MMMMMIPPFGLFPLFETFLEAIASLVVIDHHIKFHKDLSFCCRDICKTILTL